MMPISLDYDRCSWLDAAEGGARAVQIRGRSSRGAPAISTGSSLHARTRAEMAGKIPAGSSGPLVMRCSRSAGSAHREPAGAGIHGHFIFAERRHRQRDCLSCVISEFDKRQPYGRLRQPQQA